MCGKVLPSYEEMIVILKLVKRLYKGQSDKYDGEVVAVLVAVTTVDPWKISVSENQSNNSAEISNIIDSVHE